MLGLGLGLRPQNVSLGLGLDLGGCGLVNITGLHKSGWKYIDTFCGKNVDQKINFLVIYHLWRYWQGITSKSVKVRHPPLASENWTITWKRCKTGGK